MRKPTADTAVAALLERTRPSTTARPPNAPIANYDPLVAAVLAAALLIREGGKAIPGDSAAEAVKAYQTVLATLHSTSCGSVTT